MAKIGAIVRQHVVIFQLYRQNVVILKINLQFDDTLALIYIFAVPNFHLALYPQKKNGGVKRCIQHK